MSGSKAPDFDSIITVRAVLSTADRESLSFFYLMMPGSKGLNPHELARKWVKDLRTRPDMSIKVG